jgi:nicotinate-nucleotide pyrophosphorylase
LTDNHVWSAGSIPDAVKAARSVGGFSIKIEVEARSLEEAREAAGAGSDIVMLDNYTPERLAVDAAALKAEFPHVIVEGSGVRVAYSDPPSSLSLTRSLPLSRLLTACPTKLVVCVE